MFHKIEEFSQYAPYTAEDEKVIFKSVTTWLADQMGENVAMTQRSWHCVYSS